ncbi:hypothetical protein SERLA73DRAFT_101656 [Serpula lacrymans var. lacrymans S7.3]|uniref:Protein kinase domain-containing protein n=2 Tax=Serpula lacrymans var. lacrymans TaxID=341189 RepID=F8PJS8_SERL3|nr:hypothetical protein SERLA73DRAFT_101656 [Serpula lacrymans var. lacrymans S7.3]
MYNTALNQMMSCQGCRQSVPAHAMAQHLRGCAASGHHVGPQHHQAYVANGMTRGASLESTRSALPKPLEDIIDDTLHDLYNRLRKTRGLAKADIDDCSNCMRSVKIYAGLLGCAYVHLKLCVQDRRLLQELQGAVRVWERWSQFESIARQDEIRKKFQSMLQASPKCRGHLDFKMTIPFIPPSDTDVIRALLISFVEAPAWEGAFYSERGDRAQNLVDLLQLVLEDASTTSGCRHRLLSALVRLSRKSSRWPHRLVLREDLIQYNTQTRKMGGFGDVYSGVFNKKTTVSVKVMRMTQGHHTEKFLKHFSSEAVIWRHLNHPNILPFFGIFHKGIDVGFVSMWMENGNVLSFLKRYPTVDRELLLSDIAGGLQYLHNASPTILHGDLKGDNILVNNSFRACLADFGVTSTEDSRIILDSTTVHTKATSRWSAPELLEEEGRVSAATDIYAYGMVGYEIYSGRLPFQESHGDHAIYQLLKKGKRPERPDNNTLDSSLWNFIGQCWHQEPGRRPSANGVARFLAGRRRPDTRPPSVWNIKLPDEAYTAYYE